MSFEPVLPPDFDGVFRFTNPSKDDFVGQWGGKQYLFPALSTVPLVIQEHSPLEIQHIRKKFARDLAEREFYKSKAYKVMADQEGKPGNRTMTGIHQAAAYTLDDLVPYIQSCLKPLKDSQMLSRPAERVSVEDKLKRDDNGGFMTEAVDQKTSLRAKALNS